MLLQTILLLSLPGGAKSREVPNTWKFDVAGSWRSSEAPTVWPPQKSALQKLRVYSKHLFSEESKIMISPELFYFILFLGRCKPWFFPSFASMAISHDHWLFCQISPFCIYSAKSGCFCLEYPKAPCIFQSISLMEMLSLSISTHCKNENFSFKVKAESYPCLKSEDFTK